MTDRPVGRQANATGGKAGRRFAGRQTATALLLDSPASTQKHWVSDCQFSPSHCSPRYYFFSTPLTLLLLLQGPTLVWRTLSHLSCAPAQAAQFPCVRESSVETVGTVGIVGIVGR